MLEHEHNERPPLRKTIQDSGGVDGNAELACGLENIDITIGGRSGGASSHLTQ